MLEYPRLGFLSAWALVILITAAWVSPLRAQLQVIGQPASVDASADVNVFLRFDSREAATGLLATLPKDWFVVSAVKRSGLGAYLPLRFERSPGNQIRLWAGKSLSKGDVILLRLKATNARRVNSLTVAPFNVQGSKIITRGVTPLEIPSPENKILPSRANRVAVFGEGETEGVIYDLPPESRLSFGNPYTVSMWFKTTHVNELMFSTWTGRAEDDYAAEWVVDPAGFLEFYRGFDSKHVSMRSPLPVSDGNWHFVSLSYDPAGEWTRMDIDGQPADSLYHAYTFPNTTVRQIGLGKRLSTDKMIDIDPFSGQMDAVRISREAWSIEHHRSEKLRPRPGSDFNLDFERTLRSGVVTAPSELSFGRRPVEVQVQMVPEGVILEWPATDPDVIRYRLERSFDGVLYRSIARIPVLGSDQIQPYSYRDVIQSSGVVYYRLTPIYSDGPSDASSTLKVGLGEVDAAFTAKLDGNFPNPFNPSTTITYQVQKTQHIRLTVWDLSGQMISVLVDGTQASGTYEVPFVAQDLPSGTYFVRLVSDSGIQTHQMLLMK